MDYIEEDLAPFIEERLHLPLIDLKKSKTYRKLEKDYKVFYKEITSILSSNIEIYESFMDTLYEIQSLELHKAYLIGFIDGIRLDEHLRKKN